MPNQREEAARRKAESIVRLAQDPSATDEERVAAVANELLVPQPSQAVADTLWKWVVGGLVIILLVSLVGLLYLVGDGNAATSPDQALTVFTTALSGLLGLFVKSPLQNGSE